MERDITQEYTDYMYNNYYKKETNWDKHYEMLAEKEDLERDEKYE